MLKTTVVCKNAAENVVDPVTLNCCNFLSEYNLFDQTPDLSIREVDEDVNTLSCCKV